MPEQPNRLQISGRVVAGLTTAFAIVFRHLFRRPDPAGVMDR